MSSYLTKYALGNAAGEDFWIEMTRVTEKAGQPHHEELRRPAGRAAAVACKTRCVGGTTEVSIEQ